MKDTKFLKPKILEKIIDLISVEAGGRLIVFKPENSDKDLIVEKKGDYKTKVISLNVFEKEFLDDENLKKEITPDENLYLVFAHFDFVKQDIENEIFVVPAFDFQKISMDKKDFTRFLIEKLV